MGVAPGTGWVGPLDVAEPFEQVLRALLHCDAGGFEGELYSTRSVVLEPRPVQRPGPPIWIASWGSPAGLRRVARLGDGWLASAYNITPDRFREGLGGLADALGRSGRPRESFPNAIATTWLYITEDRADAERMLTDILAPMLNRPDGSCAPSRSPSAPPRCAPRGSPRS
jgi:alkanesulfonate monooxygenase SsuD/methylene tetrahydromethanopterin reductase-like flavin-dependent oxidoreductase (luciferase family)